jgi:hypothetical protein
MIHDIKYSTENNINAAEKVLIFRCQKHVFDHCVKAHTARATMDMLQKAFSGWFIFKRTKFTYSVHSPDLTLLDAYLRKLLKEQFYNPILRNVKECKKHHIIPYGTTQRMLKYTGHDFVLLTTGIYIQCQIQLIHFTLYSKINTQRLLEYEMCKLYLPVYIQFNCLKTNQQHKLCPQHTDSSLVGHIIVIFQCKNDLT